MTWFRELWTQLWITLVVALVLLALYTSLGRQFVPLVETYKTEAEQWLSEQLQQPVSIGALSGDWHLYSPIITLRNVHLGQADGVKVKRIEAKLDVLGSLYHGLPVFRDIDVEGLNLSLHQRAEQQWSVGEHWLLPDMSESAGSSDHPFWVRWVQAQRTITLEDWNIDSTNLNGVTEHIQVRHVRWRNQGMRRNLVGTLAWGYDELATLKVITQFQGDMWPWNRQNGDIYFQVDNQEWSRWVPQQSDSPINVKHLQFGARGWLKIRNGDLNALHMDMDVPRIELTTAKEPFLLTRGKVMLAGQHTGKDWHVLLRPVFAEALPFDQVRLSSVKLGKQNGWQLGLPWADLGNLHRLLQRHALLPEGIERYIDGTAPQGRVNDIRLSMLPGERFSDWQFDLRAEVQEVSTEPYRGIPKLTGVSGALHLQPSHGALVIKHDDLSLHLSDLYQEPWHLSNLTGTFRWGLFNDYDVLRLEGLEAQLASVDAQKSLQHWPVVGELSMLIPHANSAHESSVQLLLGLPGAPLDTKNQLVPDALEQGVRDWLRDSLLAGDVRNAVFALRAPLEINAPDIARVTQLYLDYEQAQLRYLPEWPEVNDLRGRLLLNAPNVDVWVQEGRTLGGTLAPNAGRVQLRTNKRGTTLDMVMRLRGDSSEAVRYFTSTPLRDAVSGAFDQWRVSGPLQADMALKIRLDDPNSVPQVSLHADLHNNNLYLGELGLALEQLSGKLVYDTRSGIQAKSLSGKLLGGQFTGSMSSVMKNDQQFDLTLEGHGDAQWSAIRAWHPMFFLDPISGKLTYNAKLQVSSEGIQVAVDSSLVGTDIALPLPLGKTSDAKRPLQLSLNMADRMLVQMEYDSILSVAMQLEDNQPTHGQILFGGQRAVLPTQPGLEVMGSIASELRAEEWWPVWQRMTELLAQEEQQARAKAKANNVPYQPSPNPMRTIGLTLGSVDAWSMPMEVTEVHGEQLNGRWDIHVDSRLLRGHVVLDEAVEPIVVELDYLHFPEPEPEVVVAGQPVLDSLQDFEPADLPAVNMKLAEVFIGGRHYGRWNLRSHPQSQGMLVHIDEANLYGMTLRGELHWHKLQDRHHTELKALQLSSKNVANIQRGFRVVPFIEGKELSGEVNLAWSGSPMMFDVAQSQGTVALRIRNGVLITDTAGTGALKAMGALSIGSVARRLRLDFSDLVSDGLAFDLLRLNGEIRDQEFLFTEPLLVDGPSGKFMMSGKTHLLHETLDMKLAVTFPVSGTLPLVAVLAGFAPPIAASIYVTERLIGDELSRFTSASYEVGGTWEEPDLVINKAFSDKVDGRKRRSFKQRFLSIFGLDSDE